VAKLKSKPSSVLNTGNPATRTELSWAGPPWVPLGTQDHFQKLDERGCYCRGILSYRVKIGHRAQPQLAAELGQALVLYVALKPRPSKTL
jgi:hypothetical protein